MTEPIFLQGVCKDYLWGGNRLREEFGKTSGADKIAESWELACHKDGSSILKNGNIWMPTAPAFWAPTAPAVRPCRCSSS